MILAIAMMALASAAIVVLTRQLGYEVTRTRLAVTDAQLRELLVAGGRDAAVRARGWGKEPNASDWQIDLPQPLKTQGATLTLRSRPVSPTMAEVQMDARIEDRRISQTLHFSHAGGDWALTDAELGG
jgi:hypothetical protein